MKAQKCPVCDGKGKVPAEFYPDTKDSTLAWVDCRSCNGTGIVVVQEEVEAVVELLERKLKEYEKNLVKQPQQISEPPEPEPEPELEPEPEPYPEPEYQEEIKEEEKEEEVEEKYE